MTDRTTDETQILDLLFSYARALDEQDWQAFATLFHDDAELVLPWGDRVPRSEIADHTRDTLGGFAATHHMGTNQQIVVSGSTGTSRSYVQATHVWPDGSLWVLGGTYDNDYRHDEGTWTFARVQLSTVWESGRPPRSG